MLEALAQRTGVPLDVPFAELGARERRIIMQGSGDTWFDVLGPGPERKKRELLFRFQFKGLYPALEEAARLSPALRGRLLHLVDEVECSACGGSRLRDDAAAAQYRGLSIDAICRQPLGQLAETVSRWRMSPEERKLTGELVGQIASRLRFLCDVGLDYLTLARPSGSLSGGEAQRIRLASQLGSGLCGVLYVLDEPTIGLHPRDNRRLLAALGRLRDLGNTLIVVEHDRDVILNSDAVLDFGPGAGKHGGQIVAEGSPGEIGTRRGSVTGPYLSGRKAIAVPTNRRMVGPRSPVLVIRGARHNNLRNIDVRIPLGTLTVVTGVSGSGKSSLINDILYAALARTLHRASIVPGAHEAIEGIEYVNKVIRVDQQPLGSSPSSNPATYCGVFDLIRELFAQLRDAKLRGYTSRRFSFNVPGGRCEPCEGNGQKRIEMHFLPDVWVQCDACRGRRYNAETLAVRFRGRSIADVLDMTCAEAAELMGEIPKIRRILQTLCDVGLDYVALGQPAPTLSGGEAQRVKLAAELARPDTGQTLYFLDEPTSGLHFDDLAKLLGVLHRLVDLGNTVIVIEHNLDVVKSADWVIDLGPDAAERGGLVVSEGTPEDVARSGQPAGQAKSSRRRVAASNVAVAAVAPRSQTTRQISRERRGDASVHGPPSYTGQALQAVLAAGPYQERRAYNPQEDQRPQSPGLDFGDIAKEVKMPWQTDGRRWHTQDRVAYNGQPCRWDGRILARVVDQIQQLGQFHDTNWNARSVVEITGRKKTQGWFFHALTGHPWLLKLKFRVKRNTFKAEVLQRELPLKPLNQMDDLPIYGNEPRIRCQNLRGPWQEVQIEVHSLEEIDTPAFWKFLQKAVGNQR
jgi:excinuclease ABC subunit A